MAWRAACECGWRSGRRKREAEADYDRRVHEWLHEQTDDLPPLTPEQVATVRVLLLAGR